MQIFESLDEIKNIEPTAIALGNFDGVHLGHQKLISDAVKKAHEKEYKSGVFTFSNHPKNFLPGKKVKNILYNGEKAEIIESLGVDYLFNIEFNNDILTMDAIDFIDKLLVDKLNVKEAFCGFNYRFGHKALGNPEVLRLEGAKKGFNVNEMDAFILDGEVVSSTLIRNFIDTGQMEKCAKYMGRNYEIVGEVVVGNKLGRTLGFPTSNLMIDESMVTPPNGVYVTYCTYNGIRYPSITNVGIKPTIGKYKKNIETHIFNFNKELYGKKIIVEFIKKTRDEKKFQGVEQLSEQVLKDCINAREFHKIV
ncbi:MAG: bifunctional riboflavin kinase/FAD synthetase [Eubacteriales bacterium]|nr:bifunctional riboflavin kinase/FAD synthetase [Eubacteriales bacterium]